MTFRKKSDYSFNWVHDFSLVLKFSTIHTVIPESWNHLSPSGGGQRGEQLLVFTEHQYVSETGVGQSSAGSADTEQVIAQDHCSSHWHCGALGESLIYAVERGGEVA